MRGHFGFAGGVLLIAAAAVVSTLGCSDDPQPNSMGTPQVSGGAILNSDFASTSVSLIDTQGALVRADCIHSTTTGTGSKTISGDVVLPSQPQRGGKIVLVDRGNTALTFVDPTTCAVDRQFSVKGGFEMANPHDVVIVDDHKAYVTRYAKNAAPADPMAAGDDLLILDPRDGAVSGRIDLSAYASTDFPASPDRAILAAGKVVVTLNRWDAATYGYGDASVVIVDPTTDQVVQSLALPGMKNCEGLDYADTTKTVLVACGGSFTTEQAQESGVAVIDMSSSPAQVARMISGTTFPTPPVTFLWVMALPTASGANRAFTATLGSLSPDVPDNLYAFDFVSGAPTSFGMATPYNLGRPAGGSGRLLVPDADMAMPRVHVYDVSGAGAPIEGTAFMADTVNGLPPREIAWY
jgi:hypothetical protein